MTKPYKVITSVFTLLICIGFLNSVQAQVSYPHIQLPNDIPKLFAKGLLSDGLSNRDFTISPAGDEIMITVQQPKFALSTILYLVKKDNSWSKPEVAPFSGRYRDLEAAFSPDGQFIYFSSDRPVTANTPKKDFDIWRVKRLPGGKWGEPKNLGSTVNSDKNEFYPSITRSGNLYFTVEAEYSKGKEDIVLCTFANSTYSKPVSLPEAINTPNYEFNAFVDPDEQFILFTSYGREDDLGGGDLYISRKDKGGDWMLAKHLPINSTAIDYCPFVTWDKQYLVFTSSRLNKEFADGNIKSYQKVRELLDGPGNGLDDLYWVKFDSNW
ncbi:MAG TPA: hypothetical protein VK668_19155 [Mucilaginibacter sp.]|nr:hypothetical protein [Mucilaginibacter sp.]